MRYAPDTNILKTRTEVKVTVTHGWNTTLGHPKMHPHTKFRIPTHRIKEICTRHETGGTDGQCEFYMPPKVPFGHKKFHLIGICDEGVGF